ncbi:MAG TPA: PQQ-dependent sugar dehydrogenase [Planctomycetota bacterium]|nr:PQQ-dependent sugar dehydrogenase [Planctomycetota bacterium]
MLRPVLLSAVVAALAAAASAQNVPTGFVVDTLVSTGLQAPHDFCFLPDGRVLIANRSGPVMVYAGGAAVTVGTVPNVEVGSERGLLSIAADPAFPSNGYIYVWWASASDAFMHLDRFTCTGDLANPVSTNLTFASSSRRVVLGTVPDQNFNHNGGSARFGPDGMLYLSIGDDAQGCPAQTTNSSLGCILRMDVSGLPAGGSLVAPAFTALDPGNNPLSANTDVSQLVIAHGLRNPFRMEIDQATGNLYIGDVGQNAVEEVDEYVYNMGALSLVNYGWPWREANNSYSTCSGGLPPGLVPPIVAIPQAGNGWFSVMGGPRYRNQGGPNDFGAFYEGSVFYLDYFMGEVRRLVNTGSWVPAPAVPGQPNATNWANGLVGAVSMRQGPDGALWLIQHPSTYATSGGFLKRIRPLGPVNSVVAVSGGGQIGPATEAFPTPLIARVLDTGGTPLGGGTVNFAVSGPGTLSTTNPVIADPNGFVQTMVTATNLGGPITVTASTPGSPMTGTFGLYSRKITATPAGSLLVLSIANQTTAVPAQVPYVVMVSFPGSPILPTIVGPLCTDPFYALTVVIEDGTGMFNFVSFSGTGGTGTPGMTKIYTLPPGLLTGFLMNFQAIGLDPVTGWFRTNCEMKQF